MARKSKTSVAIEANDKKIRGLEDEVRTLRAVNEALAHLIGAKRTTPMLVNKKESA